MDHLNKVILQKNIKYVSQKTFPSFRAYPNYGMEGIMNPGDVTKLAALLSFCKRADYKMIM